MINIDEINKQAFNAYSEFMRDRMCILDGGTGNLVMVGDRIYIATCYHVAEAFFRYSEYRYAIMRYNHRIPKENLRLVAYENNAFDLALIEVLGSYPSAKCYSISDFEEVQEFTEQYFDKTDVMICGVPAEIVKNKPEGYFHTPVSFLTLPSLDMLPSSDYLFCQYPYRQEMVENATNTKITLPSAPGFSGAFMLKVKQFSGGVTEMWSTSNAKIIGIQQSWNKISVIKGTNIKHLLKIIPK